MCRLGGVALLLLAGCSTAPVAGLKDTIDSHRRGRYDRDETRPPPGGLYDPVSRPKSRQPDALPVSHTEPADDDPPPPKPKPKGFDPADKLKRQPAPPPKARTPEPDDDPPPPRPKPKGFDPTSKVRPTPPPRDDAEPPAASDRRPPAQPASRSAPKPRPPSDERDDF